MIRLVGTGSSLRHEAGGELVLRGGRPISRREGGRTAVSCQFIILFDSEFDGIFVRSWFH